MGRGGAGHYVKMVHNGIEYGDMQLICEAYNLMSRTFRVIGVGRDCTRSSTLGMKGELESYLIEITSKIFTVKDEETGTPVVDQNGDGPRGPERDRQMDDPLGH